MKALTIRQPWAWLIVSGKKNIENRSWNTRYRGKFLIHAAVAFSQIPFEEIEARYHVKLPPREEMRRGGIIGSCDLVDCVTTHRSKWFEGPFGFVLTNPKSRRFYPAGGKLGFWDYLPNKSCLGDFVDLTTAGSQRQYFAKGVSLGPWRRRFTNIRA